LRIVSFFCQNNKLEEPTGGGAKEHSWEEGWKEGPGTCGAGATSPWVLLLFFPMPLHSVSQGTCLNVPLTLCTSREHLLVSTPKTSFCLRGLF
uniref:Uncharacterized protein n=1 Tax=Anser brachyrhynchus TaxID=132585 RepID=A0A8B9CBT8_9AVES